MRVELTPAVRSGRARGSVPRARPAFLAFLLLSCCAALPSRAQLLKLAGDVPPPPPGTGADILSLADALDRSIINLQAQSPGPGTDAAIGLRRIARALARDGEKAGAPGSGRILLARTIANDLAVLDDALARGGIDPAILLMLAANLSEQSAPRFASAAPAELDRLLRDALAPLLDATGAPPGPWGWAADPPAPPDPSAPLAPDLDRWAAIPGLTPEAIAALRELDGTLSEAEHWTAYRVSAALLRAEVRAASAALPAPGVQPWLAPEARERLARDFSEAAVALGTPGPSRDAGRSEMRRLASAARAAAAADRLPADNPGKRVRTALSDLLRNPATDREAEARALENFNSAAANVLARTGFGEDRPLVRHLRPAWKALDKDCQAAEQALIDILPRLLQFGDALTDPAVLTPIAGQRRALDDLESLSAVSALLLKPRATPAAPGLPLDPSRPQIPDTPRPAPSQRDSEPAAGWKPVADRLLKISQDLNKPDAREAALSQFRDFASHVARLADLPGESDFRTLSGNSSSPPGWDAVTGGRAAELPPAIAAAREAWLQAFGKAGASDAPRLELLATLMDQLSAAAAAQAALQPSGPPGTAKGRGSLNPWPGWELTSRAQDALVRPARDSLAKATALVLTGSDGPAAEALAATRSQFAALFLFGRLERRAAVLGFGSGSAAQSAVAELACGTPLDPDAWLVTQRDELAHICRYVEEFSSPMQPLSPADAAPDHASQPEAKPEDLRKAFIDFANSRARRVLDALDRSSP
jgi:hypothetical protein